MIVFLPLLGCVLIIGTGILIALNPAAVHRRALRQLERPWVDRARSVSTDQRDHLSRGVGSLATYVLIVSASLPVIVMVGFSAGMVSTHRPLWSLNVSLFDRFGREGPTAPTLLSLFRPISHVASWHPVLLISAVASIGLLFLANERRWLGPVLVALAIFVERSVQVTIGAFVHQPHPPTTLASYPSGGVARVVAVYGFIAFLYLRLLPRHGWRTSVIVWTCVTLFSFLEGAARATLRLHWPLDIPGGWLLGIMLLAVMMAAATVFDGSFFPSRDRSRSAASRSVDPTEPPRRA